MIILGILAIAFFSLFTVGQQSAAVVQRFGKFVRIANPGLNILIPFVEKVVGVGAFR